jgi:hypothetical protein
MCATLCNKAVMVLIESLDQNIIKAIKDQLQFKRGVTQWGKQKYYRLAKGPDYWINY